MDIVRAPITALYNTLTSIRSLFGQSADPRGQQILRAERDEKHNQERVQRIVRAAKNEAPSVPPSSEAEEVEGSELTAQEEAQLRARMASMDAAAKDLGIPT